MHRCRRRSTGTDNRREAEAILAKAFYDEYRAVCDLNAAYYLQTVEQVFQKHSLPKGEFVHRGRRVDLTKIKETALLAVEGERDDISGIGQTRAARYQLRSDFAQN